MTTLVSHLIVPNWPDLPKNVHAFSTTRQAGRSTGAYDDGSGGGGLNLGTHVGDIAAHVLENREKLQALLPSRVTFLSQIHGTIAVNAASAKDDVPADAIFSSAKRVVCAVMTADCLPILLSDLEGKFVAAVHGGWRGLADGVIENTLSELRAHGAVELTAWLGPAIGAQAFEVGGEVVGAFSKKISTAFWAKPVGQDGKYLLDIYAVAREILSQNGVMRVFGGDHCTVTEKDRFYSYRRDHVTGRMASLIWAD
jgi:YfiH family protein